MEFDHKIPSQWLLDVGKYQSRRTLSSRQLKLKKEGMEENKLEFVKYLVKHELMSKIQFANLSQSHMNFLFLGHVKKKLSLNDHTHDLSSLTQPN